MKKLFILLITILLVGTSGYCDAAKFKVGQTCVTTGDERTVWAEDYHGLFMYCAFSKKTGKFDMVLQDMLSEEHHAITPIKSGVVVLITAVEKNKWLTDWRDVLWLKDVKYGPFTIYTVHPDGTSLYYRTFGKGLKVFGK